MKNASFFKRFLSMLLIVAMLAGNVLPGLALDISKDETGKTNVRFTRVDNSEVTAGLTPNGQTEIVNEEEYGATEVVRVSIVLKKASTIDAGYSTMNIAGNQAAMNYRESLKKDQNNVVAQIEKTTKMKLDVVWNLTLAANIISANVQYGQIAAIEKLPGVKCVVLESQYVAHQVEDGGITTNMATSGAQIGTSQVWDAGYTGAGMRIAVIDTGIDTNHQSLNDVAFEYALAQLAKEAGKTTEEYIAGLDLLDAEEIAKVAGNLHVSVDPEEVCINSKIAYGYNYKDRDYDVTHDNDDQGDHGSHVAGIATANSWLYNPASGNFGKAMDYAHMQGVAPEAQLLAMKVFGKNGSPYDSDFFAAIEDAIVLGADAINLSLGSTAPGRGHHSNALYQEIMNNLTKSGVVVAISAGNSGPWVEFAANGGYLYNTDTGMNTVGQPGAFTNSLCVASVENDGMVGFYFTVGEDVIVYIEELFNDMKSLTTLTGEQEYVFIDGIGDAEDWAALADVLPGKIAICSRGEINFTEKARLAVEAGAIAVMIYNNQSGIIYLDMTEYFHDEPVVSLTKRQGEMIRANSTAVKDLDGNVRYYTGKMNISSQPGIGWFGSDYYVMSDFSSWGVPGSLEMKPEITAPGGNIYSLEGLHESGGAYAIKSGTSMASPQVAGMAALMAQYIYANGLVEKTGMNIRHLAQSLMMSTARPIWADENTYYPILQQGAGLVNINDAINADSFIVMGEGTNAGAADGKVKVELFDDPDRIGAYSATFTINNMTDEQKNVNLGADFFIQNLLSDGEHLYMDYATMMIAMNVIWTIGGARVVSDEMDMAGMDFNGDGAVNVDDGQYLLDYVVGKVSALSNKDQADVDGDGDVDSHDAYVFLSNLSTTTAVLPAGGSLEVRVDFNLPSSMKEQLNEMYPNGTYIQGFLYAETENADGKTGTSHSIPVLGFFGNWTDASMFDVGMWPTYDTGEDTRIPYTGILRGNEFQVRYANNPNYHYTLGGNPIITDAYYMPERNAINSNDYIHGVKFVPIRHADQSRVQVINETTGEVLLDRETGPVNMAYYPNEIYGWQNANMVLETSISLKTVTEGDLISMSFSLAPEYYIDENGIVDWDAMGAGATVSMDLVIDNTAPELKGVSVDLLNNTMTITASDNEYIAAAGLYNKTGTRRLAATGSKQDIEKGEVAEYTFSLDGINGKKFLVQVHDYAMNTATYLIEMQIGENAGIPDMMAFDLVQYHWTTFTKDFKYDYKLGTPRLEYADHTYYAATIADHYVFASTSKGDLYVMPEDDLSDTSFVVDMGVILYDMAYNKADGNIYGVTEANNLVVIDKLSGELTKIGAMPKRTNTLACSPDGVFYFNELGTGKIWSFTLETMDAPELLTEDPFLTRKDPVYGDHNGTEGNMGMEYDPNRNMICWNSHLEVLFGSYITYAYYYEIDPATGEFTRYNDFWHEMSCLMIPDETGRSSGWADPTDKVTAVSLNKSNITVIKGTNANLVANVQPWTATDRDVNWSTADTSIAVVDEHGVVTGIAPGTTTITATSKLDPTKSASCEVTVELLEVTINGTVMDENDTPMLFSWNMATANTWTAGKQLPVSITSATYSPALDVYYMMDFTDSIRMHKVDADGNLLASADNENNIPLWDMVYSETFSAEGAEKVTSIYYSYLLSAKDPMALDAVGFDLGSMCSYLLGITSMGSEEVEDESGNVHNTEHLIMLDNDGYIWHFWVYAREGGGFDALYAINKSNLDLELPGYDSMEHMFTSLMVDDLGNLYLAAFTGETSELYYMTYDEIEEQYLAVKIGEMGKDVWPATITSVTLNNSNTTNAAVPAPEYSMSATTISREDLAAASSKVGFTVTDYERDFKLGLISKDDQIIVNAAGTKDDPIPLVEGSNTGTAPKTGSDKYCYFTFTAGSAGTVTITTANTDWRGNYFLNGEQQNTNLINPKYDGTIITCDMQSGDVFMLMISPYISYAYGGEITFNFHFSGDSGNVPNPDCQHENTRVEGAKEATCEEEGHTGQTICTDCGGVVDAGSTIAALGHNYVDGNCTKCGKSEPNANDSLVLGENTGLTSGTTYTYTAVEDGRLEFDFTVKDSNGTTIYQYTYGRGLRVKIMINGKYVPNVADTKVTVSKNQPITVELVSMDGDTYTATLNLATTDPAEKMELGDNSIAKNTDYSFIATQDGTLYTTIKELWYDSTYCSEASLASTIVFKINGVAVDKFQNAYEVKTGDEITVSMGLSFGSEPASAVLNLSYEGFYVHPAGSRGNPYVLDYSECPASTVEIPGGTAVWYKLTNFSSAAQITVTGENAYVIVSGVRKDAVNGSVTVPMSSALQIGNAGTAAMTYQVSAYIPEGNVDNPKDLVAGDNTVTLGERETYYYDFVATQAGKATIKVSGSNWGYQIVVYNADGSVSAQTEMYYEYKGGASGVNVNLTAGQTVVVKLGTMDSSWTQPGGTLTVNFAFEATGPVCEHTNTKVEGAKDATCTEAGHTGKTVCVDCGVTVDAGNAIAALGHNYVDGVCTRCGAKDPDAEPDCEHTNTKTEGAKEATCTETGYTGDTVCSDCGETVTKGQTIDALGHNYVDGTCTRCGATMSTNALILGENTGLTSGVVYSYTPTEDGRLEFDFTVKDSNGTTIYQYAYGKGTRLKIMINGKYVPNLADTKVTVTNGKPVTVELVSVDGGAYTATLNLATTDPAVKMELGDNNIAKNTDYSFIATQDGTLYTTIKELWYDGTYCSEASLASTIVFKINGVGVSAFQNAYEVKAGDEITVSMGLSFGSESASAVLNLSYEGFYTHPAGSRGNPYILNYSDCPASIEIPGGTAVWYKLSGFGGDATITITGANAYVIVGGVRKDAVNGSLTIPAYTNLQIGNAGTAAATYVVTAAITEGTVGNPMDMVEGDNTVTLAERENYYYDFVAPQDGKVTIMVSGKNWGYQLTAYGVDGTVLAQTGMLYEYKGDSAGKLVTLTAGQYIVVKLGTMDSSWTQTGGTLTVNLTFEPAGTPDPECQHTNTKVEGAKEATCTEAGHTGKTVCVDCGETVNAGQTIPALGHNFVEGVCTRCGAPDPSYNPVCEHKNTKVEGAKEATCTEAGHTGKTVCVDCGETVNAGETIPALGHNFVDGICTRCGAPDPNYNVGQVTVEVTNPVDATNGVVSATWDPAKLTLVDVKVHADYFSIVEGEGNVTVGYISLAGIPAGKTVMTLTFEANGATAADVTIQYKELNNDSEMPCNHSMTYSVSKAPTATAEGALEGVCSLCGEKATVVLPAFNEQDYTYQVIKEATATTDGCGRYTWKVTDYGVFSFDVVIPHQVSEQDAQIVAESVTTMAGDTIRLAVLLKNNPGLQGLSVRVNFDASVMSLVGMSNGTVLADMDINSGYGRLQWSANAPSTADGVLCYLEFRIAEDAQAGNYPISLVLEQAVNGQFQNVPVHTVAGNVEIVDMVYGDVNSDGKVDLVDLLMLRTYLANLDPQTGLSTVTVGAGADANGDGSIGLADVLLLRQYLVNRNPATGESSVVLGPR